MGEELYSLKLKPRLRRELLWRLLKLVAEELCSLKLKPRLRRGLLWRLLKLVAHAILMSFSKQTRHTSSLIVSFIADFPFLSSQFGLCLSLRHLERKIRPEEELHLAISELLANLHE